METSVIAVLQEISNMNVVTKTISIRESDYQLMKFYSVNNITDLIDAMEQHILKLQYKLEPTLPKFHYTPLRIG